VTRKFIRNGSLVLLVLLAFRLIAVASTQPPEGIPATIQETEGPFTGTWIWNGNGYNATWDNGAIATLTVKSFTSDSVVIDRTDTANSVSYGLTAVYTGKISTAGDSIVDGDATWTWPGVAGYPATGNWSATWTNSTPPEDCSKKAKLDESKLIVRTVDPWYWTNIVDVSGVPNIYISAGNSSGDVPYGIYINAQDAVDYADSSDKPKTVLVQNLTGWAGDSTYESEDGKSAIEWNAIVNPPQKNPLELLDVPNSYKTPFYDGRLVDSPEIHAPLKDSDNRRLSKISYTKNFKTFIGCKLPSDSTFHPIDVVFWRVRYEGHISYSTSGKPKFVPDLTFPVEHDDPISALDVRVQTDFPNSNCFTVYKNFDGKPTNPCDLKGEDTR
jgi:hypothetical protein